MTEPTVTYFTVYETATGRVLRGGYVSDEAVAHAQAVAGESVYMGAVLPLYYISSTGPVPMGPPPSSDHRFDWTTHQWALRDIEELREAARRRVDEGYNAAAADINAGYPTAERDSWPMQIREARILLADAFATTPWIDAAASTRGITRMDLAQSIAQKDEAYGLNHGLITGRRQFLQGAITEATTAEAVMAIVWTP